MSHDWQTLWSLTGGREFRILRVAIPETDIKVEGDFALPPLAKLSLQDQIFAAAFLASHGSLKKMESLFGISYPTVKNRLNRIGEQLDVTHIAVSRSMSSESRRDVLERLDGGEITFDEAMEELR